jgi:hypothetical protein
MSDIRDGRYKIIDKKGKGIVRDAKNNFGTRE